MTIKENSHIFYAPEARNAKAGQQVYLPEDESAHCSRVLRLRPGQAITIIDGAGGMYNAELTLCGKSECAATITEILEAEQQRQYRCHVAIAPTKNIDRLEWFVEKAVEFGIDEITPLLCDHSERKILKADRLMKIAISAAKQSGNAMVPVINEITPFASFVEDCGSGKRLIAHCEPQEKVFLGSNVDRGEAVTCLIGPEGDFSDKEIAMALSKGFLPTSLGNSRLRTETAGVAVCAFLAMKNI
ncbi:MAG: 16S rRNA (uracil(1498)-N(3))-methyltransferase [Bacteroidales bacterium]|nr:16S rRNA (uracil(1498)-N(3))-methyltransferase [Bacteroidales bacterium]